MTAISLLFLASLLAVGGAANISNDLAVEDRQGCGPERPLKCDGFEGTACLAREDYCDGYSHCRKNVDEKANCVYDKRNDIKNLLQAYSKLIGGDTELKGQNRDLVKKIFGNAEQVFMEITWILKEWDFPLEYTYLEMFYNNYLPRSLHRVLLYSDTMDPKMFAAYLTTQGMVPSAGLKSFITDTMLPTFRSLVTGGYFNILK